MTNGDRLQTNEILSHDGQHVKEVVTKTRNLLVFINGHSYELWKKLLCIIIFKCTVILL